jgi:hypothetical protein
MQGYTLLRLRHIYEAGEHPTLSQPAQVDLAALFKGITVSSVQETTLTGAPPPPSPPGLPSYCKSGASRARTMYTRTLVSLARHESF